MKINDKFTYFLSAGIGEGLGWLWQLGGAWQTWSELSERRLATWWTITGPREKKKLKKKYKYCTVTTVTSDFGHEVQARAATVASGENSNNITSEINVKPLLEPAIPVVVIVFIDYDDCRSCSEQLLPLKPTVVELVETLDNSNTTWTVVFLTLSKNCGDAIQFRHIVFEVHLV